MLDLQLILRNKRARQMILGGLATVGYFVYLLVTNGAAPDSFTNALQGLLLSGFTVMMYGQYSYSWHGDHFDGLLVRTAAPRALVQAQAVTLAGLCVVPPLVFLPVILVATPTFVVPLGALLVYNIGVTVPFLLCMATGRRQPLHLDQTAFFNYQGTTYHVYGLGVLGIFLVAGVPIGLMVGFKQPVALLSVTGIGLLGLCTAPLWTRAIGRLLRWHRHAMAAGFRATD